MVRSIFLTLLLTPVISHGANASSELETITKFVGEFMEDVRLNNIEQLVQRSDGNLNEIAVIKKFLSSPILPYQTQPLSELIIGSESTLIVPVSYGSNENQFRNGYTVFFMKKGVLARDVLAQKKKWLLDYAACDFFIENKNVSYGLSFCYEGTEGPFFIPQK